MSPIRHFFRLPALALALLVAVSPATIAQLAPFDPALAFPGLSQAAVNNMHAAAAKLYEGRPVGAVETWATPDGTMSGQVKLLHSFDSFNMPCRTIDYTIRFQGMLNSPIPDHYVLNWCRVPAGVWKIVQIPSPS